MALVAVPDLEVLARLFLDKELLSPQERYHVVRIMYGGQVDDHDFHRSGFDEIILAAFLQQVS